MENFQVATNTIPLQRIIYERTCVQLRQMGDYLDVTLFGRQDPRRVRVNLNTNHIKRWC